MNKRRKKKRASIRKKAPQKKKANEYEPKDLTKLERIGLYIWLAICILLTIIKACYNASPGYDQWIGMPWVWR